MQIKNFMKKLFTILAIVVIAVSFGSCKKDYNCTCKISDAGIVDTTYSYPLGKKTKKDAESACTDYQTQQNAVYTIFGLSASCGI